jgi:hypothetical protein
MEENRERLHLCLLLVVGKHKIERLEEAQVSKSLILDAGKKVYGQVTYLLF